jgi:hypothetical protein
MGLWKDNLQMFSKKEIRENLDFQELFFELKKIFEKKD